MPASTPIIATAGRIAQRAGRRTEVMRAFIVVFHLHEAPAEERRSGSACARHGSAPLRTFARDCWGWGLVAGFLLRCALIRARRYRKAQDRCLGGNWAQAASRLTSI